VAYAITQSCCKDASCVSVCPVDCIHPTPDEPDFGTADIRASDWQNDPAFTPWVSRLVGAVDVTALSAGTPLATMAIRQSALDVAATTDAELGTLGGDRFVANYPEPSMWVEAVVAVPERTAVPDDLAATLTGAVATAGWDDAAATTTPLPGPTTMLALRALWQESS
jgi:NAD-dependent dihydropyrimidine dehydrogenase PreA subunit